MDSQQEIWTSVFGKWASDYEVSNLGKVRRTENGLLLKASPTGKHHRLQLKLRDIGGTLYQNVMLSHIVISSFRHEDVAGRRVEYKDKNPENCALENLYYVGKKPTANKYGNNGGGRHETTAHMAGLDKIISDIFGEILPETQKLLKRKPMQEPHENE